LKKLTWKKKNFLPKKQFFKLYFKSRFETLKKELCPP